MSEALPYLDSKPAGHADFYFAINATFRFILARFGEEKLREYWTDLGTRYNRQVSLRWQECGLGGVAEYLRAFFRAEPGADVEVTESADEVRLEVKRCPAIGHLRANGREIVPSFCQHCYFVSEAIAQPAGLTVRVCGGNGNCVQRFVKRSVAESAQNLHDIATAS